MNIDDGVIAEQGAADAFHEFPAEKKIVIAVHYRHRQAGGRQCRQGVANFRVRRLVVVVAQPLVEQIAEYVQCVGMAGFLAEELDKSADDVGAGAIQMHVGDKQRAHARSTT